MLPNADQVGVGLAEPTILWALGRDCRDSGSNSGQRLGSVYRGRDGVHVATAPGGVQMTVMMSLSPPSLSGKLREQPAVL